MAMSTGWEEKPIQKFVQKWHKNMIENIDFTPYTQGVIKHVIGKNRILTTDDESATSILQITKKVADRVNRRGKMKQLDFEVPASRLSLSSLEDIKNRIEENPRSEDVQKVLVNTIREFALTEYIKSLIDKLKHSPNNGHRKKYIKLKMREYQRQLMLERAEASKDGLVSPKFIHIAKLPEDIQQIMKKMKIKRLIRQNLGKKKCKK